jgi:hypothetical protein
MVATLNVAASNAYYARGSEYYLGAKEPDGGWYVPAGDLNRPAFALPRTDFFSLGCPVRKNDAGLTAGHQFPPFPSSAPRASPRFPSRGELD